MPMVFSSYSENWEDVAYLMRKVGTRRHHLEVKKVVLSTEKSKKDTVGIY